MNESSFFPNLTKNKRYQKRWSIPLFYKNLEQFQKRQKVPIPTSSAMLKNKSMTKNKISIDFKYYWQVFSFLKAGWLLKAVTCIDLTTLAGYINIVYIYVLHQGYMFLRNLPPLINPKFLYFPHSFQAFLMHWGKENSERNRGGGGNGFSSVINTPVLNKTSEYKSDIIFCTTEKIFNGLLRSN